MINGTVRRFLQPFYRIVGINGNNQEITQFSRFVKRLDMPGMQYIKTAIGEYNGPAFKTLAVYFCLQLFKAAVYLPGRCVYLFQVVSVFVC